jgi:hypothetical protein
MSNAISLAAVRAARQGAATRPTPEPARAPPARQAVRAVAPKPQPLPPPPAPPRWRESQAGNLWTKDACGRHVVIFQNRRGWGARVTLPSGEAWFENMPGVEGAEEARAWAEGWLAETAVRTSGAGGLA